MHTSLRRRGHAQFVGNENIENITPSTKGAYAKPFVVPAPPAQSLLLQLKDFKSSLQFSSLVDDLNNDLKKVPASSLVTEWCDTKSSSSSSSSSAASGLSHLADTQAEIQRCHKRFKVIHESGLETTGSRLGIEELKRAAEFKENSVLWSNCNHNAFHDLTMTLKTRVLDFINTCSVPDISITFSKRKYAYLVNLKDNLMMAQCVFALNTIGASRLIPLAEISGFVIIRPQDTTAAVTRKWTSVQLFQPLKMLEVTDADWREIANVLIRQTEGKAVIDDEEIFNVPSEFSRMAERVVSSGLTLAESARTIPESARNGLSAIGSMATSYAGEIVGSVMSKFSTADDNGYQPIFIDETNDLDYDDVNDRCDDSYTPKKRRLTGAMEDASADYTSFSGTPYQAVDKGFINDDDIFTAFEVLNGKIDDVFSSAGTTLKF
jgi:hypothetical protein